MHQVAMPRRPAKPSKSKRQALSADRIVAEALALVDAEGLEGFSFRILARRLHCEAMSLYHYFPSKAHLFDAMLEVSIDEMRVPATDQPWQTQLTHFAREFRQVALRHPGFFLYFAIHRLNTPAGLRLIDSILGIFEATGLDPEARARSFRSFGYYLMGAGLDEAIGYSKGPAAAEPVPDDVVARDFPAVSAAGVYFTPGHREATFEWGLKSMLDGVEALLAQSRTGEVQFSGMRPPSA
jgi:AcrR family transcriptional regulator